MEVDGTSGSEHTCGACGKAVCFSCSVSRLGEHRRCLVCASASSSAKGRGWNGGESGGLMGWVGRVAC